MAKNCSVLYCESSRLKDEPGVTFYNFPVDKVKRAIWSKATGQKNWHPSSSTVICSKHFKESDFVKDPTLGTYLKEDAEPFPINMSPKILEKIMLLGKSQSSRRRSRMRFGASKRSKSQKLRRLKEKIFSPPIAVDTAGISRQKELVSSSEVNTENDPSSSQDIDDLQVIYTSSYQDIYDLQVISNTFEDSNTALDLSKTSVYANDTVLDLSNFGNSSSGNTDQQYNQTYMNSTEKTPVVSQDVSHILTPSAIVNAPDKPSCAKSFSHIPSKKPKKGSQSAKKITIRGRRIIDFEYFFNALKKVNQHSESGCNLNDIIIISESKHGLFSSFHLRCKMCDFKYALWSVSPTKQKKKNINTDAVAGMLSINCSFWAMNKLLSKMDLPRLNSAVFNKARGKISSAEAQGGITPNDETLKFPTLSSNETPSIKLPKTSEKSPQLDANDAVFCHTLPKKICKKSPKTKFQKLVQRFQMRAKAQKMQMKAKASASNKSENCEQEDLNSSLVKDILEIEKSYTNPEMGLELPHSIRLNITDDNLFIGKEQAALDMTGVKNITGSNLFIGKEQVPFSMMGVKNITGANFFIGREQPTFNMMGVRNEINSNVYHDSIAKLQSNQVTILNNDNFLDECANISRLVLSQQKDGKPREDNVPVDKKNNESLLESADTSKATLSQQQTCDDKIIFDRKRKLNYIEL